MKAIALGLVLAGYTVAVYGWAVLHGTPLTWRQAVWPGAYTGATGSSSSPSASSGSTSASGSASAQAGPVQTSSGPVYGPPFHGTWPRQA